MLQKFRSFTDNDYPTSDGRPMAETDLHRNLMFELIDALMQLYAEEPNVYVSGNVLIFYEEGNKRRHISPDVFVVKGVSNGMRPNYLLWEEGKGPDVVIEVTSKTTRAEDVKKKYALYQDRLGVREYFLFDPTEDYLQPSLQGFRRVSGEFRPIRAVSSRLPSKVLGLHLERSGEYLRLWNPATGQWEPTRNERLWAEEKRTEAERIRAEEAIARAEQVQAELKRVERELERLRQRSPE